MPRKPDPKNGYLELHDGYYRVTMGVPAKLRPLLGYRLKQALGTKSLLSANVLKRPVVKDFKARIDKAWETLGNQPRSAQTEAIEWAKTVSDARQRNDPELYELLAAINLRAYQIRFEGAATRLAEVDDGESLEQHEEAVPREDAEQRAAHFAAVARGTATPISLHHDAFIKSTKIKERSLKDDVRALHILLKWCAARGIEPYLERVTIKVAVRFVDEIEEFTGLGWASCTKYIGRLRVYWKYLVKRTPIETNVWIGIGLSKPRIEPDEEERAFTDAEVQRLLMGTADPAMLDVMLVAGLTGARLDAVIDLRVGECADGWFTFKPQKKERTVRDVPIHPELRELVARRAEGKKLGDDLFPEWPGPRAAGSVRERSSYFSKRFTKYRRDLGVDDVVEGKRRSLVNFHSFRRWFITKAERAGVDGDLLAAIVGHKRSGLTLGRYSEGPEMEVAKAAVAKVRLPPLDGSPIVEARPLMPRRRHVASRG